MPHRVAPNVLVFVDGNVEGALVPVQVQRSCGGQRLDTAELVGRLDTGNRIVDYALGSRKYLNKKIQVADTISGRVFHTGIAVREDVTIEDGTESLRVISRTEPWMFGEPIVGRRTFSPGKPNGEPIDLDLIFNPVIDRTIEGNRAVQAQADHPLFVDPESVRTAAARTEQGTSAQEWKLSEVLVYLMSYGNLGQFHITNSTPDHIRGVCDDARTEIRHLHLPHGLYLPEALDRVLTPLGYSWYLVQKGLGQKPAIQLFSREKQNRQNSVVLQAPGSLLRVKPNDPAASNMIGCNLSFDAAQAVNRIRILGDYLEIESTWELGRGWPVANEEAAKTNLELCRKGSSDWEKYETTWRLFILNEDGSFNGTRPELEKAYTFDDVPEVKAFAAKYGFKYVPRRRRFLPCLTLDPLTKNPFGQVRGMRVEYRAKQGTSGTFVWRDCTHDIRVLRERCGVYFSDVLPPQEIVAEGTDAKVRITATVRFDWRIGFQAKRNDTPLAWWNEKVLVLDDRFGLAGVSAMSKYSKDVQNGTLESKAKDDQLAMAAFGLALVEAWNMASVNGTLELEGVDHTSYELGDNLGSIVGRNISLNAKLPPAAWAPHIVGITYQFQRQRMTLNLERFRADTRLIRQTEERGLHRRGQFSHDGIE